MSKKPVDIQSHRDIRPETVRVQKDNRQSEIEHYSRVVVENSRSTSKQNGGRS